MRYRHTKHQVARGSRADAETHDKLYLIKRVSEMRATYQVRLLTYLASETGRTLVVELPEGARIHRSLRELRKGFPKAIRIVRN